MAAQMTAMEMLVQEIEQLQNKKTSLQATVKAAESKLKDLLEQVVLKEYETRQQLVTIQETYDTERASLSSSLEPLRGQVASLKNQVQSEETKLKALHAHHATCCQQNQAALNGLTKQVDKKQSTLQALAGEIDQLKAKVASL